MKNILNIVKLMTILVICLISNASYSQSVNAKIDADGNYVEYKAPATEASLTKGCEVSAAKYKAKDGTMYKVYLSKKGKVFIVKKSKKGNYYRYYLRTE